MSSNHVIPGVSNKHRHSLTPKSSKSLSNPKLRKGGSPIMHKLTSLFKRDKENGHIPVRPACFADSPERRRSESPEPAGMGRRKNGAAAAASGGKKTWKTEGGKDALGVGWRPKGRLEWESDSGRQITVEDIPVSELSKVETHALQRLGISVLQNMEIPVSHGLLKGSRNVFPRISFNTFKQRRVTGNERPVEGLPGVAPPGSGVFGQPLDQVVFQDQPPAKSGYGTPIPTTPTSMAQRSIHFPPSTSPTSTTSSEASFVAEPLHPLYSELNSPSVLLESLNISPAPQSPKSKRRLSLCPQERQVPSIVTKAINYLDTKGVKTEGLFRISGAKSRINEIREKFDSGEDVELTDDMNPHDVACLLKEFLRSLPEALMTVDLYTPLLATRKLNNPGQRRDALRLLCLLLPQANRDTLQELLKFLSRVALHSDGIILIDGTEEVGNRMTEQNLAMIMGPNILHKDVKRRGQKTADFQVQKQDPDELNNVCRVMEDLIRMQISIFTIPAKLYDDCLKAMLTSDPASVDLLLKRRCYEQGLFLEESPMKGLVCRSNSTGALRTLSTTSGGTQSMTLEQELQEQEFMWQRTHSLSDTQKVLDDAIRNLEEYISEDLASLQHHHRHYSSNDSAMGGSEMVVSPVRPDSTYSEPATLDRKGQVFHSTDSAFSNNSSPTNSSDGTDSRHAHSHSHSHSEVLSSDYPHNHIRMLSEVSNASTGSPAPPALRLTYSPAPSPAARQLKSVGDRAKDSMQRSSVSSLPGFTVGSINSSSSLATSNKSLTSSNKSLSLSTSLHSSSNNQVASPAKTSKMNKKRLSNPSAPLDGTYSMERSPILSSRDNLVAAYSETKLDSLSSDHTPTESAIQITSSPSGFSLDSHEHNTINKNTII